MIVKKKIADVVSFDGSFGSGALIFAGSWSEWTNKLVFYLPLNPGIKLTTKTS